MYKINVIKLNICVNENLCLLYIQNVLYSLVLAGIGASGYMKGL